MSTAIHTDVRRVVATSRSHGNSTQYFSDFAVGFSRQPLPKGKCFALLTKVGGPCIMATDAAACYGFELAKLRPEKLEARLAKLPPTATFFSTKTAMHGLSWNNSTPREARIGIEKITNGVKQQLPGMRLLGEEVNSFLQPPARNQSASLWSA